MKLQRFTMLLTVTLTACSMPSKRNEFDLMDPRALLKSDYCDLVNYDDMKGSAFEDDYIINSKFDLVINWKQNYIAFGSDILRLGNEEGDHYMFEYCSRGFLVVSRYLFSQYGSLYVKCNKDDIILIDLNEYRAYTTDLNGSHFLTIDRDRQMVQCLTQSGDQVYHKYYEALEADPCRSRNPSTVEPSDGLTECPGSGFIRSRRQSSLWLIF